MAWQCVCVPNANFKWECIETHSRWNFNSQFSRLSLRYTYTRSGWVPHCHLSLEPNLTLPTPLHCCHPVALHWIIDFPRNSDVWAMYVVMAYEWQRITSPPVSSLPQPNQHHHIHNDGNEWKIVLKKINLILKWKPHIQLWTNYFPLLITATSDFLNFISI